MLLQSAVSAASQLHPLSGTIAEWVWLLPILPLAGFVINGLLSLAGAHFGPSDPNTPAHDDAGHPHADRVVFVQGDPQITHVDADAEDDHHGVKRHRWAGAVSGLPYGSPYASPAKGSRQASICHSWSCQRFTFANSSSGSPAPCAKGKAVATRKSA